ncbi:MAG: hypothetical protein N4A49_12645 [Marinifilaceae bacterium]|jgi:hypothetical protein|nr:hypothetical protein [Marinifilaceae bacterium]
MGKIEKTELYLIIVAASYNLIILIISLLWIFTNSFSSIKSKLTIISNFNVNENVTYGMFLAGALGGSFYCLKALYQRIGETFTPVARENAEMGENMNMKAWIFWYLYRPIQAGVLALILLVFMKSNLINLGGNEDFDISHFYTLIGFGFLAGFGSHELIHKIIELIQVIFAKSNLKPNNSKDKIKENRGE